MLRMWYRHGAKALVIAVAALVLTWIADPPSPGPTRAAHRRRDALGQAGAHPFDGGVATGSPQSPPSPPPESPSALLASSLARILSTANVPGWASEGEEVGRLGAAFGGGAPPSGLECVPGQGSQSREDEYAYHNFFFGRTGGCFLEAGALNGVHFSNTVAFERQLGWRGLLVEASPWSYKRLATNRPGQIAVHAALCAEARTVHWADSLGARMGVRTGGAVSGIVEFMAPGFKRRFYRWAPGGPRNLTGSPVACVPLSAVLRAFGIRRINWFSLDVEGGELEVLHSVDFGQVQFDVVNVEADGLNPQKDEGVRALMRERGFRLHGHTHRIGKNDWFIREGFEPSANPECAGAGGNATPVGGGAGCLPVPSCRPYNMRASRSHTAT